MTSGPLVDRYLALSQGAPRDDRALDQVWDQLSLEEKQDISSRLSEEAHARNARHAEAILRSLPPRWRSDVIRRLTPSATGQG